MANRKKSNFPGNTSVLSGANFDYFVNGVNYKITFDNLLGELGATGTLVQSGPATAVPVLDIQGGVNNIRNLSVGDGMTINVDPENGILIGIETAPTFSTLNQIQIIYVAKAGEDTNSGLNINAPKLTIQAAIVAASLMVPASNNQITIEVIDTGDYIDAVNLPEWVHINAPSASLDGILDVSDNCLVVFRRLSRSNAGGSCIKKTTGTGFAKVSVDLLIVTAGQNGFLLNSGVGHIDAGVITVDGGIGIKAKNGSRVSFIVSEVQLSNGGVGIGTNEGGGDPNSFSGNVLYAKDDGTGVLLETRVSGDVINIQGGSLIVDTLYDLAAGTTLNVFANEATGSRIFDPTTVINATLSGGLNNTININRESDFPVQDATTITLEAGPVYMLGAMVTTAKRFICEDGSVLKGIAQTTELLEYTGTGDMFTSSGSFSLEGFSFRATNGTIFNATGSSFVIIRNVNCQACTNIGTFNEAGAFASNSSFFGVSGQGFQMVGASSGILFTTGSIIGTSATFKAIDLGTSTTNLLRVENSTFSGVAGSVAISGLASSGNINSGKRALVLSSDLSAGDMVVFENIVPSDVRWFVGLVTGSQDSRNFADALLTTLQTVTVTTIAVFEEVDGGNWTFTEDSRFTTGTDGVMTYIGEVDIEIMVSGFATVEKVGGGSNEIEARFAKNWTAGSPGMDGSGGTTQNATPTSIPLGAAFALTNGDDIRMIVANNDGTSNIQVSKANLIIREA